MCVKVCSDSAKIATLRTRLHLCVHLIIVGYPGEDRFARFVKIGSKPICDSADDRSQFFRGRGKLRCNIDRLSEYCAERFFLVKPE
mmetsp:Transcript_11846/g.20693  ORF Transcript_11846/g.20693 Transcript_11846/m.20693 type:complete len:86 (-) Transcript_11846:283-540(-)